MAGAVADMTAGQDTASMHAAMVRTLARRERYRDDYRRSADPIANDRLLWRAQTFRHCVHLMPGESILELGCGDGAFTQKLVDTSRGENPITAVGFAPDGARPAALPPGVEYVPSSSFPRTLRDRQFDFVIAMDLLDRQNCTALLQMTYSLLKPGGQLFFYESNPWNVILRLRRLIARTVGSGDSRRLLSRSELYELTSEIGFIRIWTVFNDFVYRPLTRSMVWLLRNLSILLENAAGVRTLAGSILLQAQKPPRLGSRRRVSLCVHESLRRQVSVVIPCHNEEMNIRSLVTGLRDLYGDYLCDIVTVDDNSSDATAEVIRDLAAKDALVRPVFRSPPNGVGRALADGYRAARGAWVLSMDCDFEHLLPELRDLFDAAAMGYDVIVGSRFSRHSVLLNYPFAKIAANRGFHLLAQVALLRSFRDLTNNLKLMRREVASRLILTQPGFAANAETGLQPLLMGCSIKEVPISWINRTPDMGTSSFRLARVGRGYGEVLWQSWLLQVCGRGRYRDLQRLGTSRHTIREAGASPRWHAN